MENTLYFKDMIHCDQNNYPKKVYKVEYSKMLIEILDSDHIQGRPFYFSSPHSRDDFIKQIKDHIGPWRNPLFTHCFFLNDT